MSISHQGNVRISLSAAPTAVGTGILARPEVAVRDDLLRAAFELHQGPAQYLANATMRLQLCLSLLAEEPDRVPVLLHQSIECTQAALESIRACIDRFRHPVPTVVPRIGTHLCVTIDRLRSLTQAEFHVNVGDIGTVPHAIAEGLAAVAAEALTNAAKHADAKHISVTLSARNGTITLKVGDDGRGFDWAAVRRRSRERNRAGLFLMRAQIRLLGGELRIRSAPSKGTQVSTVIPANAQFALTTHPLRFA